MTKQKAELFLEGIIDELYEFTSIDDAAAVVLAKHQGDLQLGVLELSHAAAEALAQHAGGRLDLARLRGLTVGAAKALAKHQGDLELGIEKLSKAAAEALAEHAGGGLNLARLKHLNEGVANALAFHKGSQYMAHEYLKVLSIGFDFCTPVDLQASEALAHLRSARLTLRLAKGAAKALARGRTGCLSLSVAAVSDEDAESLAQLEHFLSLPRLKALTNLNLAHKLVHSKEGEPDELFFNHLKTISSDAATVLARFPHGCLQFASLESISDEVAEIFAKALETGALRGLWMQDEIPCSPHARRILLLAGGIDTNTITELDVDFAKAFAKQQRGLSFNRLIELSPEVAEELSKHEGHILWVNGLTELSEPVASALAKHRGGLGFNGLRQLTDQVAVTLAKSQGQLSLNGLSKLSLQAAIALGGHEGDLTLEGLKTLTEQAALELANHRGRIFIGELELSPKAAKLLRNAKGEICGEICEREPLEPPRQYVWKGVYLRRVWADVDGVLDLHFTYESSARMDYALVMAMNYARAEKDSSGGSLRNFYAEAVDQARANRDSLGGSLRDFFFVEAADSDNHITVDEFEAREDPGIPVCDEFAVVVDEADRIHFLPFQLQTRMSDEEWAAVSTLWGPWLAKAPLDEDERANWQVCLTKAEFLGQPG